MTALFVVLTFVLFIIIDILVLKFQKKKHPAFENAPISVFNKKGLLFPENILISKGHTWVQILQGGLVKIGIDDFVMKALGKLSIIDIVKENTVVKKGDIIFQGAVGRKRVSFRSPIEGTIKMVNKETIGKLLNDPYENSWGIILSPINMEENLNTLKSGNELTEWLRSEFIRLKEFLSNRIPKLELAGATMHDGGNIIEGAVSNISEDGIQDFEKEFLTY
jgi:glycine cleavage system H lipoate-binding protein